MELLLIRHALPVRRENVEGPADPELAETGHRQAEALAAYLAAERIDAVYSSPLRRARQTAAPVAAAHGLEVIVDDELAEYDRHSKWYVPVEELKASGDPRWQDLKDGKLGDEDIEVDPHTFADVVESAIERLVAANPSRRIAVVCHGGVINAYVSRVLGLDDPSSFFYPIYTSVHRVAAARSGERSLLSLNETAHLRGTPLLITLHG